MTPSFLTGESSVVPLVFVEVIPIVYVPSNSSSSLEEDQQAPYITNFGAKESLLTKSLTSASHSVFHDTTVDVHHDDHNDDDNDEGKSTLDGRREQQQQQLCIRWNDGGSTRNLLELSSGYLVETTKKTSTIGVSRSTTSQQPDAGMPSTYYVRDVDNNKGATEFDNQTDTERVPLVYLPSDDPTILEAQPCCIVAYAYKPPLKYHSVPAPATVQDEIVTSEQVVVVTSSTLVRILPARVGYRLQTEIMGDDDDQWTSSLSSQFSLLLSPAASVCEQPMWLQRELFLQSLLGEIGNDRLSTLLEDEVIRNHNPETIDELTLKLSMILSKTVHIGTTHDACHAFHKQKRQLQRMKDAIRIHHDTHDESRAGLSQSLLDVDHPTHERNKDPKTTGGLQWWPAIIVHSPNHSDGKTLLVQTIANRLGCTAIHLIRPGTLLAKYGSHADTAVESRIHSMVVSAACRNRINPSVCIILDQLDTMLPPQLSGRSSAGDAAVPILNSMSSYLRKVTTSIQKEYEFPFPIKNVLYNNMSVTTSPIGAGQVLPVKLCLVGIMTCPDDGWRSTQRSNSVGPNGSGGSSILDCMIADRYRVPLRTAKTRLKAFRAAFDMEGLTMDSSCIARLGPAAASAAWARGGAFSRVAKRLKQILYDSRSRATRSASVQDLEFALASVKSGNVEYESVKFQARAEASIGDQLQSGSTFFESVGGNLKAKAALEDALALDPIKREMLSRFCLSPPSGVLLYGPPGCGKTLLAKAVAKLLTTPPPGITDSSDSIGGTFISVRISDIVSAELGTSEKIIVSTFEFADKSAPSVIFLDEFQSLFIDRSRGGSGKLTTTLLQCLDLNNSWSISDKNVSDAPDSAMVHGNRITVIGATNTPWMIDSAFLRPGRFDRVVHVGLPSSTERGSILRLHISRMRIHDSDNVDTLSTLCESLAKRTKGFSGADLAALCHAAAIRALIEKGDDALIDKCDFDQALDCDVKPSSDEQLVHRLSTWRPQ
jgi:ATP-dependent 26S proteasome regulatory subunit